MWQFREARSVRSSDVFILLILVAGGVLSILGFADWWFREEHIVNAAGYIMLSLMFWYGVLRLILIWVTISASGSPSQCPRLRG